MKTSSKLGFFASVAAGCLSWQLALGQTESVTRGIDVKGPDVVGSDVKGGNVTTGGSVTGGSVTGGSVNGATITPGTVTAFADGREFRVSAVDAASINVNGGNAEVKLGSHLLIVEKTRMTLDGKAFGTLSAEVKKVEVAVKDGMVSVKGDGKEVAKSKLN